jgi:protein-S-isoprenylcysteine O-methyltransferase Ste14
LTPGRAIEIAWVLWLASWTVAAVWSERVTQRPPLGQEWRYRVVTLAGAILLVASSRRFDGYRLWSLGEGLQWLLVLVALAGFAFMWWARLYLGSLWSSSVTRKADHRVVDTGPYAIVRHPIYTGIIAAIFATAFLIGTPAALVGAILMSFGFWIKARLEESFLGEQLDQGAYQSYRRRVPMLLPFGPRSV